MKRILFIIPWSGYYIGKRDCSFETEPERAPEGIVGLATYLKAHNVPVRIADMQQMLRCNNGDDNKTLDELWSLCLSFEPDVIGFSFFTARFKYAHDIFNDLVSRFKTEDRKLPLMIAGGVHPTLLPQNTLSYIPLDAVIIGEGELPLLRLAQNEKMENIRGFFLPGSKNVEKADVIANLDEIPFPDWNLTSVH